MSDDVDVGRSCDDIKAQQRIAWIGLGILWLLVLIFVCWLMYEHRVNPRMGMPFY